MEVGIRYRLLVLFLLGLGLLPSHASAQDRAVVQLLTTHGRMPRAAAQDLVRSIDQSLRRNADRGGDRYDRVRQAIGGGLFGGPGTSRDEYARRLTAVLERMRRGLDPELLRVLFAARDDAPLACAERFRVTMADCDALIAAASERPAAVSYLPPDDGQALLRAMADAGVSREVGEAAVRWLRETMLAVPRNLSDDARGRGLVELLEACPGALTRRESQVRAWHVGPTEGLVRCIVQTAIAAQDPLAAQTSLELRFDLSSAAAQALIRWHSPATARALVREWMNQGRRQFQSGNFQRAAIAYRRATEAGPDQAGAWSGLGASLLRSRNAAGAANAFQRAVALAPRTANFHAMLGRARAAASDRRGAIGAFSDALSIDPNHAGARQGLAELGVRDVPTRARRQQGPATAEDVRTQALSLFRARRFSEAAAEYARATTMDPNDARAFAGLGAARAALGDIRGSVDAYANASFLAPDSAGYLAALGRAKATSGDLGGAVEAYRQALSIDPNHQGARSGLSQLGVDQMRDQPTRDEIMQALRPLERSVAACQPNFHGVVTFKIQIFGPRGQISDVQMDGPLTGTPEGECMIGVVRGATFPQFADPSFEVAFPYRL